MPDDKVPLESLPVEVQDYVKRCQKPVPNHEQIKRSFEATTRQAEEDWQMDSDEEGT